MSGSSQVKSADPVEIIGSAAGVLVRSVSWRTVLTCTSGGAAACPEARAIIAELDRYKIQDQPSRQITPEYQRALDRFAAHHVHDWPCYDPDQQTYDMWEALPLIVLAGQR